MPSLNASVAPSGQSIFLIAKDDSGDNTNVTSFASPNEVQSISLTAAPSGNAFTLTFDGHTTSSIPTVSAAPYQYMLWTFPVITGHSYAIGTSWVFNNPTETYYEILQGGVVVSAVLINPSPFNGFFNASNEIVDAGNFCPDGTTPVYWGPITISNVVATGTTMQMRFSGGTDGPLRSTGIRVFDSTADTITYYGGADTDFFVTVPDGFWSPSTQTCFEGVLWSGQTGTGFGPRYLIDGGESTSALVLQGALQSLSNIGSDNLTVVDQSAFGSGNYQITFTGTLARIQQSLVTCGDGAVSIVEDQVGGSTTPTLTINGGSAIPLYDLVYDENTPQPYILIPLFQSTQAVQTGIFGQLPCQPESGNWLNFIDDTTQSGYQVVGFDSGLTLNFLFTLLKPAIYQVAISYSSGIQSSGGITYEPYTATQFEVKDDSGTTLGTYTIDQTANGNTWVVLDSFTTSATLSSLSILATTVGLPDPISNIQKVATLDAVKITRTSSDLSIVITNEDTAVLTTRNNWLTTAAGLVPGNTYTLGPPAPILPTFSASPKTMKAGLNIEQVGSFENFIEFSNLAYLMGPNWPGKVNSDCFPTTLPASRDGDNNVILPVTASIYVLPPNGVWIYGDSLAGTFLVGPGKYVATWDGDPSCSIISASYTAVTPLEITKPSNVTKNWVAYDITCTDEILGPLIRFEVQSTTPDPSDESGNTYLINLTSLAIYPPDPSDPTGNTIWGLDTDTNIYTTPPKFHPSFLYKCEGMQCFRYLGPVNANNNGAAFLSHFKQPTHCDRSNPTNVYYNVPITTIQAPTDGNYFIPFSALFIFQVTTASPHNLGSGMLVKFSGCGTATWSGGSVDLSNPNNQGFILCHVVDDVTLICGAFDVTNGSAMTNMLSGGSLVNLNYGTYWALEDFTDHISVTGATDFWFNMPITMDITPGGGAYQVALFLAENTPEGVKVHIEPGNECWNNTTPNYIFCSLEQAVLQGEQTGNYQVFYANQGKAIQDQCLSAFASVGRENDLIMTYGAQGGFAGQTAGVLAQLQTLGGRIDELAPAIYYNNYPFLNYNDDQFPIFDSMSTEQLLDYYDVISQYGGFAEPQVTAQLPFLDTYGFSSTKITAYEGGVGSLIPYNRNVNDPNFPLRQNAVRYHPRIFATSLQWAQYYQDAGVSLWNYFDSGGVTTNSVSGLYESGNQQRGTGNISLDAINLTEYQNKNVALTEIAGAWSYWGGLIPQALKNKSYYDSIKKITYSSFINRGYNRGNSRTAR